MYFYYVYAMGLTGKDKDRMDNRYATVRDEHPVNVRDGFSRISNESLYERAQNYEGCADFMWAQYQILSDEPVLFVTKKEVSEAAPLREKDILFCFHLSPLVRFFIKLLTSQEDESNVSKAIVNLFYFFSKAVPPNLPDSVSAEVSKLEKYFKDNINKNVTLKEYLAVIGQAFAEIKKKMEAHLRSVKSIDKKSFDSFCRFIEEDMKDIEDAIDDALSPINDKKIKRTDDQISFNADDLLELRREPFSFPLFSISKTHTQEEKHVATSRILDEEQRARRSKKHKKSDSSRGSQEYQASVSSLPSASSSTASLMLAQIALPGAQPLVATPVEVEQIFRGSLAYFQAAKGVPVGTPVGTVLASPTTPASTPSMPSSSSSNNNTSFGR